MGGLAMGPGNGTGVSEFVLLGLASRPATRRLLFPLFLGAYLATLLGNLLVSLLIRRDPRLRRAPMYFFLAHLSLADVGFTSAAAPTALGTLAFGSWAVPYAACLAQNYVFIAFGVLENFLLAVMAYDRYLAVCRPLRYTAVMSPGRRWGLVGISWGLAQLHALLHTLLLARLPFPARPHLRHFFCDLRQLLPLLRLSCSPTRVNEAAIFFEGGLVILGPFLFIAASYARIGRAVLQRPASERRRALSTCSSHLTMVALFYGAIVGVYFQPGTSYSAPRGAVFSVMYTVVTPAANPFVYSLRNKDVQGALRRLMGRGRFLPEAFGLIQATSSL
uniref:Olfactory receptor n=1 Tax=Terrapene triunguis TaxID=2587831 RepID=A0A674J8G5_9SAUR